MVDKADQARLRALMREAVTMLCKTGINFEAKFSVEGLLGITVDDKDIMLINLNETVLKYDNGDNCDEYQSHSEVRRDREPVVIEAEPAEHHGQLQIDDSDSTDSLIIAQANEHEMRSARPNVSSSQNKQAKAKLTDSPPPSDPANPEDKKTEGFFSPTVNQIIQEYEQQQYSDSSSLLYMARKRRRKYPDHVTELHTQGLLPILPEAMISILPKQAVQVAPPQVLVAQTQNKSVVKIKKEPGTTEAEDAPSSAKKSRGSVEPITIEPKSHWTSPPPAKLVPVTAADHNSSLAIMASVAANAALEETLWVEDAILKQEGCFVSTRVILRKHGALRGDNVVHAMKCMTHRRGDPRYVGEYRQSGRIQVFYKCPPLLLSTKALERYNMTLDQYSNYFFGNPKPNNGTPSQWSAYINTVLDGIPYSPKLFPIESMNLGEEEFRKLSSKRDMLEDRFVGARDDDSVLGGFRADDTEGSGT